MTSAPSTSPQADYILFHKPNISVALIEAKDNTHPVGAGMQQALAYAEALDVPFVYSSNGDAFLDASWGQEGKSIVPPAQNARELIDYLVELGVFRERANDRIDVPDIYLFGLGLRRKGGVRRK